MNNFCIRLVETGLSSPEMGPRRVREVGPRAGPGGGRRGGSQGRPEQGRCKAEVVRRRVRQPGEKEKAFAINNNENRRHVVILSDKL